MPEAQQGFQLSCAGYYQVKISRQPGNYQKLCGCGSWRYPLVVNMVVLGCSCSMTLEVFSNPKESMMWLFKQQIMGPGGTTPGHQPWGRCVVCRRCFSTSFPCPPKPCQGWSWAGSCAFIARPAQWKSSFLLTINQHSLRAKNIHETLPFGWIVPFIPTGKNMFFKYI